MIHRKQPKQAEPKYTDKQLAKIDIEGVFEEYLGDLKNERRSARTITSYTGTFKRLLAYIQSKHPEVKMITFKYMTEEAVKGFITSRNEAKTIYSSHPKHKPITRSLSDRSIHLETRNLKAWGTWLGVRGYPNPFVDLKNPKLSKKIIEILSHEEIEKLLNLHHPRTFIGARWQAMISFFLDTGVRVEELSTLRADDVDMINYRAKVVGKGDKERLVTFGNRTHRALTRFNAIYRPDNACEFVFINADGERLTVDAIQNIIKRARKTSGIPRLHCHLFRHTWATYFIMNGGDPFTLKLLIGHESLTMTQRYVTLAESLKSGVGKFKRLSVLDDMNRSG